MAMNRFVGLGILALSSMAVTIAACSSDDSGGTTTSTTPTGTTPGGTTPGGTTPGGTTPVGTTPGGTTPVGTTPVGTTPVGTTPGGTTPVGTKPATTPTGTGTKPATTTPTTGDGCSENLLAGITTGGLGETGNWIGGDPTVATDDPCGIQGSIFAYSDEGLDKKDNTNDESVVEPKYAYPSTETDPNKAKERLSPANLTTGEICISGNTTTWPVSGTEKDYTAKVWGGGFGIDFNDPGRDETTLAPLGEKKPYAGPAKGFKIKLTCNNEAMQPVRISFKRTATDEFAPFVGDSSGGSVTDVLVDGTEQTILFSDADCPTNWGADWVAGCGPLTGAPFAMQFQVVGGDLAGAFSCCLQSLIPVL